MQKTAFMNMIKFLKEKNISLKEIQENTVGGNEENCSRLEVEIEWIKKTQTKMKLEMKTLGAQTGTTQDSFTLVWCLSQVPHDREKLTKMLSLHFPKEQRGLGFLEKTNTQLLYSSYFIQICVRLIGAGKGSNHRSHLVLAAHESRQPTEISVCFDYDHNQT